MYCIQCISDTDAINYLNDPTYVHILQILKSWSISPARKIFVASHCSNECIEVFFVDRCWTDCYR